MMNDALKYKVQQENQRNQNMFENQQNILNRNVEQANRAKDLKNQLAQNAFENQIRKQGVMSGATSGNIQALQSQANLMSKGVTGVTKGISGAVRDYADYSNRKKDTGIFDGDYSRLLPSDEEE